MPRLRQAVAQKVADRLFAVEDAIDVALTRAAELNAAMPEARAEARLPAMIGQDAFDRAAEASARLSRPGRRIVETHESLDQARVQMGLGGRQGRPGTEARFRPGARGTGVGDSAPRGGLTATALTGRRSRGPVEAWASISSTSSC